METATLTTPQAKSFIVQPVQKSLSLPSYARASGEGIDHRIIFAALEQKERIRRKSKIFRDKEKCGTSRQNYFCLPLPSSARCKETSLSSDTSCSSLEFQKPKKNIAPSKNKTSDESLHNQKEDASAHSGADSSSSNSRTEVNQNTQIGAENQSKVNNNSQEHPVSLEVPRNTVGSSDSMERAERSSKSSNDSVSRRERLVAVKARVEAEREKFGDSSSDEENNLRVNRVGSDGVVHRTVREVKAKSRPERRLRRKSQEESALRRAQRRQHTSLYITPGSDLDFWKPPPVRRDSLKPSDVDIYKDFLGSDNSKDCSPFSTLCIFSKEHNYFSDICGSDIRSQFVKKRVKNIEAEELKNKLNLYSVEKVKKEERMITSETQTNESPGILKENNRKSLTDSQIEKSLESLRKCISPYPRAPTPPPRSPKSMTYVNKAIIQHQAAAVSNYLQEPRSLERKKTFFQPNIPATSSETPQKTTLCEIRYPKLSATRLSSDIINSRRKTCGNFTQLENLYFERTNASPVELCNIIKDDSNTKNMKIPNVTSFQKYDSSIKNSKESSKDIWLKLECMSEKKFNSLENSKKDNVTSWIKKPLIPKRQHSCLYHSITNSNSDCFCNFSKDISQFKENETLNKNKDNIKPKNIYNAKIKNVNDNIFLSPLAKLTSPSKRLSKSEVNLSLQNSTQNSPQKCKKNIEEFFTKIEKSQVYYNTHLQNQFELSAAENLDTAMEELETIYQSLHVSGENLSEKNTSSNIDDVSNQKSVIINAKNSDSVHRVKAVNLRKVDEKSVLSPDSFSERLCSDKETNSKLNKNFGKDETVNININQDQSICKSLCIDELFSDLTEQLDFEQKLLEESRHHRSSTNSKNITNSSNSEKIKKVPDNPSDVVKVNFEKNVCNSTAFSSMEEKENFSWSNVKQRALARRKCKAIRSLSANLSYLMQNSGSDIAAISDTTTEEVKCKKEINVSDNESSKCHPNSPQNLHRKLISNRSHGEAKISETPKSPSPSSGKEIREIRVSMGSSHNPGQVSNKAKETTSYSRLHSALRLPKEENALPTGSKPLSRATTPSLTKTSAITPLDESELEKLLNTLLSDSNPKDSSLEKEPSQNFKSLIEVNSTSYTEKGEMLVMKHLDVIRCLSDPS